MEVIEMPISRTRTSVFKIYPVGDIHSGSVHCDEEGVHKRIKEIKSNDNALWIGMGDYADCITKDDKRFDIVGLSNWVEKDNIVESQRSWLKELFNPIKEKCICLLTGNHEESIHAHHDNDITRNLCKDLGVRYGGYHCFIPLRFERVGGSRWTPIIHAWHGAGAAQTEGARIQRLMRLVNDIVADIYFMGHLHAISMYQTDRLRCEDLRIRATKIIALTTGSWLKTYNQPDKDERLAPSYGERAGYKPSCIGAPVIRITPEHKEYVVEA